MKDPAAQAAEEKKINTHKFTVPRTVLMLIVVIVIEMWNTRSHMYQENGK